MLYFRNFKSDRFRRLSKEGFWVLLGQAGAVFGSLVGVRILTELLSAKEYGEFALGLTLVAMVNQTILGPLANGVTRFYSPASEQGNLAGYLKAVRRASLFSMVFIFLLGGLVVAGLMLSGQSRWVAIATAALIFSVSGGFNLILNGMQNAARQRTVVALHQGVESWARFLCAAGLLLVVGGGSTIAMIGYVIASMMIVFSQYIFFKKTILPQSEGSGELKTWLWQMWKYSWPFAAWGIFYWAQSASDRWALALFSSTKEVGLYAVLFQLGYYPMSMLTSMAMQLLAPIFYQRAGDATNAERNANVSNLSWRLTRFSLYATCTAFLITFFLHSWIFHTLAAKEYGVISYLLPWMILSGGIFAAGQTLDLNLMSQMKTRSMLVAKIVTAVVGVLFNILGAYFLGVPGIVISSVMFSAMYFVWMVHLIKNRCSQKLSFS